jgi:NADH:ubiquinone oxidoreductase subunit 4 (subunit M)
MHGPKRADLPERHDLTWTEGFALVPLVLGLVLLGINPHAVASAVQTGVNVVAGTR